MLLTYKSKSWVSFQILHVSNISCKYKTFFGKPQNFWKIYSMNEYMPGYPIFWFMIRKIFLKTQRLDLQMVANNSTRWNSSKKQHEKLVAILIFSYKISGIPAKSQTVWKIPQKYILADQIYFYCIFMRKKVWQKYYLFMQKKWLCKISSFYVTTQAKLF